MEKEFYMEGTKTTSSSIIKENSGMLTDEEIKAFSELKVGESVYIGNINIKRIK